MKRHNLIIVSCLMALSLSGIVFAQTPAGLTGQTKNYISTGMPILLIAPDATSAGMGDVGVASTPDIYSAHWNNAKFAFIDGNFGIGTTYTPWLRNLKVSDMNLLYLGAFKRINNRSTVALSLTYFSLGEIQGTDTEGQSRGTMNPNEFAADVTYAMKLNENLSLGATGRYIHSDLTNGQTISDGNGYVTTQPAKSLAADIGLYWQSPIDKNQDLALGAFISNLGAKLSYSDVDTEKEFLPANLRLGGRYTNHIDASNEISILLDANKLLVPTPPVSIGDQTYSDYYKNPTEYHNTGVIRGAVQSFYDAPGGLSEELREFQLSMGGEYWYKQTLAARAGYFYESATKGGRQYLTFGFGLRYNILQFDVSYLVPTTSFSSNPLSNTIRISLTVNFKTPKNTPTI